VKVEQIERKLNQKKNQQRRLDSSDFVLERGLCKNVSQAMSDEVKK
jgi:hypothetical protein